MTWQQFDGRSDLRKRPFVNRVKDRDRRRQHEV
jgi:hypothetical protein